MSSAVYDDELSSDYVEDSNNSIDLQGYFSSYPSKGGKCLSSKQPDDASSVPRKGSKNTFKRNTIKDLFKKDMKELATNLISSERVLAKVSKLNQGESFVGDFSDAPDHMFKAFDRSAVMVDMGRMQRTNRILRKSVIKLMTSFHKHLKNKSVADVAHKAKADTDSDKGHNCSCIIKGPLLKLIEITRHSFVVDGSPVQNMMPMLRKGFCKKLTFQHYINLYNKVNGLIHKDSNQCRRFDSVLTQCLGGMIPADKLYIKLPVELKYKEVDITKVKSERMKELLLKIGTPLADKTSKLMVNVFQAILDKTITREEYLMALPHITTTCKDELLQNYFNPPEDGAKMKIPMDLAVSCKMVPRALNTVELAHITKPDFDPDCYPAFFANFLTTLNLDTIADLKPLHILGDNDRASREMAMLKDPETIRRMDEELVYIKSLCKR